MDKLMKYLMAFTALFMLSTTAYGWNHLRGVCTQDFKQYCSGQLDNKQAFQQCVKSNKAKFSTDCQQSIEDRKQRFESCKSDIMKYCGENKGDKYKMRRCISESHEKFSQQCQDALSPKTQQ